MFSTYFITNIIIVAVLHVHILGGHLLCFAEYFLSQILQFFFALFSGEHVRLKQTHSQTNEVISDGDVLQYIHNLVYNLQLLVKNLKRSSSPQSLRSVS